MWIRSYTKVYQGVKKEEIWRLWSDVNNWHRWDPDIEYSRMEQPFVTGSHFFFKPKGMSEIKLQLVEVIDLQKYTDSVKFFGAKLFGTHEMEEIAEGLRLTTTIKVSGILKFLWIKLVAQDIVNTLPEQMDALVKLARIDNA